MGANYTFLTAATESVTATPALKKRPSAIGLTAALMRSNSASAAMTASMRQLEEVVTAHKNLNTLKAVGTKYGMSRGIMQLADYTGVLGKHIPTCAVENFDVTSKADSASEAALESIKDTLKGVGNKIIEFVRRLILSVKTFVQKIMESFVVLNGKLKVLLIRLTRIKKAGGTIDPKVFDAEISAIPYANNMQLMAVLVRSNISGKNIAEQLTNVFKVTDGKITGVLEKFHPVDGTLKSLGYDDLDTAIDAIKFGQKYSAHAIKESKDYIRAAEKSGNELIAAAKKEGNENLVGELQHELNAKAAAGREIITTIRGGLMSIIAATGRVASVLSAKAPKEDKEPTHMVPATTTAKAKR